MSHNPDKSRVLCAVASATHWSLYVLERVVWGVICLMLVGIVLMVGFAAYGAWYWPSVWRGTLSVAALCVVFIALCWAVFTATEWAKRYRKDC